MVTQTLVAGNIMTIIKRFNEVLDKRISEFLGQQKLPGALAIEVPIILLILMISEQEKQKKIDSSIGALTKDSLLKEAMELGIPEQVGLDLSIHRLSESNFVIISEDGKIRPTEHLMEAAELISKIFPKMSGINMIAYLVQTIEEVLSGRKDIEFAVKQFDDTLKIQGRYLGKRRPATVKASTHPSLKEEKGRIKPNQIIKRLKTIASTKSSSPSSKASNIISSGADDAKVEIKAFEMSDLFGEVEDERSSPSETHLESDSGQFTQADNEQPEQQIEEQEPHANNFQEIGVTENKHEDSSGEEQRDSVPLPEAPRDDRIEEKSATQAEVESQKENSPFLPSLFQEEAHVEPIQEIEEPEKDPVQDIDEQASDEEEIEKRIEALELDLALLCPLCKRGKIEKHTTSNGKIYYQCNLETCNFISWGKPVHTLCPVCQNPFLIEITSPSGEVLLKCPRATCGYKGSPDTLDSAHGTSPQPLIPPGPKAMKRPKKRVVRRRVVRRKR